MKSRWAVGAAFSPRETWAALEGLGPSPLRMEVSSEALDDRQPHHGEDCGAKPTAGRLARSRIRITITQMHVFRWFTCSHGPTFSYSYRWNTAFGAAEETRLLSSARLSATRGRGFASVPQGEIQRSNALFNASPNCSVMRCRWTQLPTLASKCEWELSPNASGVSGRSRRASRRTS